LLERKPLSLLKPVVGQLDEQFGQGRAPATTKYNTPLAKRLRNPPFFIVEQLSFVVQCGAARVLRFT
jgi:hypothetical protein